MNSKDIIQLFKGIGVIIDNGFKDKLCEKDIIWKIRSYFEKKDMPILSYSELPSDNVIGHLNSVSFILLDWNLSDLPLGVPIPDANVKDNVEFLKSIKKQCFTPIFIFTNEDVDSIIDILVDNNLYDRGINTNHIFVKSKSEIKNSRSLFSEIVKWVRRTPSIYILKEWEVAVKKASADLFVELYETNPSWPYVMYKNYYDDLGGDNSEICDLINRNLIARCTPITFDKDLISKKRTGIGKTEIRKLLEKEKFLYSQSLQDFPAMGDIFKIKEDRYLINIRPDCDILRISNPELYCIKGCVVKEDKINKRNSRYEFKKGAFREQIDFSIVPFIDNGKIIEFKFKDLDKIVWEEIKDKRVGRLLPPYITRLKLQYMAYLQRQAIPSIPNCAIK